MIEISRIKEKLESSSFKQFVFSKKEIEYCEGFHNYAQHFAGRFAAKEAFLKALGDGWTGAIDLVNIEIINGPKGQPYITVSNQIETVFIERNITKCHLSITHLKEIAAAVVVLEMAI